MTQMDLAVATGMSLPFISKLERGLHWNLTVRTIGLIASALHLPPEHVSRVALATAEHANYASDAQEPQP